jgi:regulator of protease activity HflC (stomatin/prohibitin superfamily)
MVFSDRLLQKEIMRELAQKYAASAVLAGAMLFLASTCFYVVDPTDVAGVRRLGTVVSAEPVGPGLHFKLPLIASIVCACRSIRCRSII